MKVKQYSGEEERTILTALVVNTEVLGKVVAGLKSETDPFRSKWANLVFSWCSRFYLKYQKAPRGSLQSIFRGYAAKQSDDTNVSLVEKFLVSLSDDYRALSKEINPDFVVDLASKYFNEIRYGRLRDELEEALLSRDVSVAQETIAKFAAISFGTSAVVDVFTDEEEWRKVIEAEEDDTLITYPGDLGEFFGTQLKRDSLVAYMAPEKRGKSFWLIDAAWRAVREKRKTFFFSVGDMSKKQMLNRFGIRATRRPIGAGRVLLPRKIIKRDGGEVRVKFEEEHHTKRVSMKEWMAGQRRMQALSASEQSLLKLVCTPNSTTTVADIDAYLDEEEKSGWIPDVVVIDYADILAPEAGAKGMDFRQQTNDTWKALRRLSQERHCLVITATQSDAASYDAKVISKRNFSEDKRKLSHVTGMVGINQTEEEKGKGVYRLNWVLLREGEYFESRCITVAGCLAIANPAMRSIW